MKQNIGQKLALYPTPATVVGTVGEEGKVNWLLVAHVGIVMEAYDFQGKTIIPFATSGGSSIKKACTDLKAAYPNLNWKEGKLLNRTSKAELQKWVESNR